MATEDRALKQVVERLEAAWNRSDSAAWASAFAEDADCIHILGGHYTERANIESGHRVIFDTDYKGSALKLTVEKIRLLTSDVAIAFLFASLTITHPGMPPQLNARPTLFLQRQDGGWKAVMFQNTAVAPEGAMPGKNPIAHKHPFQGQMQAIGQ